MFVDTQRYCDSPMLNVSNKYIRPFNTGTEIYAGRVACCPLVNYVVVEYASCDLLRLEKDGTDRRTDARPLHYAYR